MSSSWGSITRCLDPTQPYHGYDAKPYFTSKAAMNMLAAQYAVQLGKSVRVNVVSPGFCSTGLNGFHEHGADPKGGAVLACRFLVGAEGEEVKGSGIFMEGEEVVPW
jgi:NAD(P)-dependent dehydrogenase (short-subunit alcohol dehydrogenase family)